MACRWPPPNGMHAYSDFGPMNRPFYQQWVPGPFSPQACWGPFPPANQWQTPPPPQSRPYQPHRNNNSDNNRKRQRKEPVFIDFCDVCDRGFKNLAKKVEHFKQHVKCGEPRCNFEAHFKIVAIHKQNLHGPNALKIKLDTPEDVERWRIERKRKYPTIANVERKAKKSVEEEKLGNVLENKYFGKVQRKRDKTVNRNSGNSTFPPAKPELPVSKALNLLFCDPAEALDDSISSEEDQGDSKVTSSIGNSVGLGSLMQSYASESDEDETIEELSMNAKVETPSQVEVEARNGERPDGNNKEFSPQKRDKSRDRSRKHGKEKSLGLPRGSLLEMLLAPEIRRERNHILQCVRFIVKNHFFETEDAK